MTAVDQSRRLVYLPGIAGLRAGVAFVTGVGVSALGERGAALAREPADGLRQIDGLKRRREICVTHGSLPGYGLGIGNRDVMASMSPGFSR